MALRLKLVSAIAVSDDQVILLIEDDAKLAGMVRDYLGKSGFDVTIAGTGKDGLARQKKHHFDAIVLDLMLPDTDGLEVCRTLRATD